MGWIGLKVVSRVALDALQKVRNGDVQVRHEPHQLSAGATLRLAAENSCLFSSTSPTGDDKINTRGKFLVFIKHAGGNDSTHPWPTTLPIAVSNQQQASTHAGLSYFLAASALLKKKYHEVWTDAYSNISRNPLRTLKPPDLKIRSARRRSLEW